MLRIRRHVHDKLIAHAKRALPIEACGYLAGRDGLIERHYELTNADDSGIHYSLDPEEQFAAIRHMRSMDLSLRAVYHSHPTTRARPSTEDIRLAYDQSISYVIISLLGESPVLESFRITDEQVSPESIDIVEEG